MAKKKLIPARAAWTASGRVFAKFSKGSDKSLDMPGDIALDGDEILVAVKGERCELKAVTGRARDGFVGCVYYEKSSGKRPRALARPTAFGFPARVIASGVPDGFPEDELAEFKISRWPNSEHEMRAKFISPLGSQADPRALCEAAARSAGFELDFPDEARREAAKKLPLECAKGRRDLRKLRVFTIDGADARDFDDAVSLVKKGENLELGVHIADVSAYVKRDSALDCEARARGTSVYMPALTLPMLPEELSNGECSLLPGEDRLAVSVILTLSGSEVKRARIFTSLIRSRARLTYEGVNRLFANEDTDVPKALSKTLLRMRETASALNLARAARGAIDLDMPETLILLDDEMYPMEPQRFLRGESERMIEAFMLLANETVARYCKDKKIPIPYRAHEPTGGEALANLNAFLARTGIKPLRDASRESINALLAEHDERHVKYAVMRSMMKARYAASPVGHFALALEDYCHFTSPIRRYPDLLTHRALKWALDGSLKREQIKKIMPGLCQEASENENRADRAERMADKMLSALFMSARLGEAFSGRAGRVTPRGVAVELDDGCDGFLPIENLPGEWLFLPDRCVLAGAGGAISEGRELRVIVSRAVPSTGEIEFKMR